MAKYLGRISHSEDIANKQYVDDQVEIALTAKDDVNEDVQAHISNTSNPHKVTKSQVGLGNVNNTSDANKPVSTAVKSALDGKADKSQVLTNVPVGAKFTDTVYTHPETHPSSMIIESSLRRFVTDVDKERWNSKTDDTALNQHVADKQNPHSVTKSQVGLGSVQNYGVATQAQSEDGTVNNSYMTPLRTKQAIDKLTTVYTGGSNVTISGSVISAIDTIYDDSAIQAHMINEKNPHKVTKSQVALGNVDNIKQATKTEFTAHVGDSTHITSAERISWNSKQDALEAGSNISIDDNTISATDTIYTHPSSHPASMITESSTKRFVTDADKSNWNSKTDDTTVDAHIAKKDNPHSVTKAQVGLANVDNIKQATKAEFDAHNADTTKHITKAERNAWNAKQGNLTAGANVTIAEGTISAVDTVYDDSTIQSHIASKVNPHGVTKAQVGLGNVSNVAQASKTEFDSHNSDTTKHITANERTAWNNKQNALGFTPERASNKGKAGGYASLDSGGKVPASELPSYVDDVVEATTLANLPTTGETGKIYVTTGDNKTYRWSGTGYTEISASLALGATSSTAYRGDLGNVAYAHSQATGNPHGTTKAQVGLGNVDNTSDANKPVSTAMQAELDKKVNNSQVLTDVPANAKFTDTVYTHPSSHPASMITESTTKRFVSDTEKATWNGKTNDATVNAHIAKKDNPHAVTKAQVSLGNVDNVKQASKTEFDAHVGDATHATIEEKDNWNAKQDTIIAGTNLTKSGNTLNATDTRYNNATTVVSGLMSNIDKVKLDGIATGANNYTHPTSHPASMITETSTKRFVTDAEKSTWNSKQNALTAGSNVSISGNTISATNTTYVVATTSSNGLMASGDKSKLDGIAAGANNYSHPSSHPASMITESTSQRFVSDSEKSTWNGKWNYNENTIKAVKVNNASNADTVGGRSASDFASLEGVSKSWKIGNITNNVARCLFTGTPTEILIKTKIPFRSGTHMPVIHIQGYAYGLQSPVELKIGYYIYDDKHGYCGAVSMGAWQPEIKLFSYIGDDNKKYTGVALLGSIYFPQFSVGVQIEHGHDYERDWTVTSNMGNNTVYHMPNSDVVNVPYKSTFSSKINGVTFNGLSDITITANPNSHTHDERYYTKAQTDTQLNGKVDNAQVLTNVPSNAKFTDTVYLHPSSHPASMITETSTKRFVTDAEKATWNGKQNSLTAGANITISGNTISAVNTNTTYDVATTSANGLMSSTDKVKLNGIATGANNYTHPSSHPASIITQDASNRFVTDSEKATWNGKQNSLTAGSNITISGNTISAVNSTYGVVTTSANGLMTAADKVKLNGIAAGANNDTIKDQRTGNQTKFWTGTQAQYNAIGTKDANTLYVVSG